MIHYLIGDATYPTGNGNKIIAHICNDIGLWGKGFVLAVSKRWKEPEEYYKQWYKDSKKDINHRCELGNVLYIEVDDNLYVANMVAQHGILSKSNPTPIRYDALEKCLNELGQFVKNIGGATIHMPRIGCGLGGGTQGKLIVYLTSAKINEMMGLYRGKNFHGENKWKWKNCLMKMEIIRMLPAICRQKFIMPL